MKIAVYAIAKNEEKHVARFMASTAGAGADGVFVLDTGSGDGTAAALESAGAVVKRAPAGLCESFRFDAARNLALHLVPGDYEACVVLDLDEVLSPGWRDAVEAAWRPGETASATCRVISSRDARGRPNAVYWGKRIHGRSGWFWKYPAHNLVVPFIPDVPASWANEAAAVTIEHFPDKEKSRDDRLGLLELAVRENPHESRPSHYLGREYFFRGDLDRAEVELKRHLTLTLGAWHGDRAASMRFLGWIENRCNNPAGAIAWFLRECAESPADREPWVDLAQAYHDAGDHAGSYFAAKRALAIGERPRDAITYGYAWGERPYDLAALSAWRLGLKDEARAFGEAALKLAPDDARLKNNLELMRKN